MLELIIALLLLAMCILPLGRLPFQTAKEEYRSAYRMQAQRLADLAYAEVKEKLHKGEIPWKEIARERKNKAAVLKNEVAVSIKPLGSSTFSVEGFLYSTGKQGQNPSEERRLATLSVKVTPKQKKSKIFRSKNKQMTSKVFTYHFYIHKSVDK